MNEYFIFFLLDNPTSDLETTTEKAFHIAIDIGHEDIDLDVGDGADGGGGGGDGGQDYNDGDVEDEDELDGDGPDEEVEDGEEEEDNDRGEMRGQEAGVGDNVDVENDVDGGQRLDDRISGQDSDVIGEEAGEDEQDYGGDGRDDENSDVGDRDDGQQHAVEYVEDVGEVESNITAVEIYGSERSGRLERREVRVIIIAVVLSTLVVAAALAVSCWCIARCRRLFCRCHGCCKKRKRNGFESKYRTKAKRLENMELDNSSFFSLSSVEDLATMHDTNSANEETLFDRCDETRRRKQH